MLSLLLLAKEPIGTHDLVITFGGFCIVIAALVVLFLIFTLFSKLINGKFKKNKEEKGVQVASARGRTQQAVGHCRCPQQLFLLQPERNSVSPSLFVAASSGFQSMHSSNPKVRNSPSGNTQR